jgi:two-component system chemotaxis response regulator CheB
VLIVQHIHPDFVQGLVAWMARVSPLPVIMAEHGQRLRSACVHIGPGGTHLRVGRDRTIELVDSPITLHRPSADQLFESVAARSGESGVGVLLTGMGDDGAAGLAAMHRSGAHTIVQDEATSAVYGMPRAAMRLGVVDRQLPLPAIADAIVRAVSGVSTGRRSVRP